MALVGQNFRNDRWFRLGYKTASVRHALSEGCVYDLYHLVEQQMLLLQCSVCLLSSEGVCKCDMTHGKLEYTVMFTDDVAGTQQ